MVRFVPSFKATNAIILMALLCLTVFIKRDIFQNSSSSDTASRARKNSKYASVKTTKNKNQFILTFLGDTMFANVNYNWEVLARGPSRRIDEGFDDVKHLLQKSDFIIMNLEGTITMRPRSSVPEDYRRREDKAFGMHPDVIPILQKLGIGVVNLGNNHGSDYSVDGYFDTKYYLQRGGLSYFGSGMTVTEQAEPFVIDTPQGRIGVTSFVGAPATCCDTIEDPDGNEVLLTLRPTKKNAHLAMKLLDERKVDVKIGFPHWMPNRISYVPPITRDAAKVLANAGYDVLIGSAGSHTVKEFDWVRGVPTFFDIGNFVFMKEGLWKRRDDKGRTSLSYGSVTHMIIKDGRPKELEIHCTQNDQDKVHYKPRVCTAEEAAELFSSLGPYINHTKGESFARVDLQERKKITNNVAPH